MKQLKLLVSFILFGLFMIFCVVYPFVILHEYSHASDCIANGGTVISSSITWYGGFVQCSGQRTYSLFLELVSYIFVIGIMILAYIGFYLIGKSLSHAKT